MHPIFPAGTIGHLLEHGGEFLCNRTAFHGETSVTLQSTNLQWREETPHITRVEYSLTLDISYKDRRETIVLEHGDHYGNIHALLHKKVELHEHRVREQLQQWTKAYADYFEHAPTDPTSWVLNAHNEVPKLLACLLFAPRPHSLVAWAQTALQPSSFQPLEATYKGHKISLVVHEYAAPSESLGGMQSTIAFSVLIDPHRALDPFWGEPWMSLGLVDDEWLERPGPTSAQDHAYVDLLLAKWHEDTDHFLKYALQKSGFACLSGMHWQFNMPSFWIFDLLNFYFRHGAPPPPPVPAWTSKDIARAARILKRASDEVKHEVLGTLGKDTSRPFAVYDVNGYTLVFADDLHRPIPFYAFSILLRPPQSNQFITILMNDVWNPQAARVIDGDAFALRRLLQWLRGAIKKNKCNERVTFEGEDEDTEEMSKTSLWVTDWLLLGQPEPLEETLVDWRCQHCIANAGPSYGIAKFAGIYGFSDEYQKRIVEHDIPAWRAFLRDVIDPRFNYTWGA